tara:strand:+ start:220 stop:894 length:675 start_codon:yes stop_codon:yes gene_type:complete
VPWNERGEATISGLASLVAPIIIISSILFGIATPTESAAIAVFYVLFLGVFIYRSLTFRAILKCAGETALSTSIIMLTVATSKLFAWIAVKENLGEMLTNALLFISNDVFVLLILINILLLILGMIMEILPIMLILAPVLFPLLEGLGVDPIHFGVVMVLNLMIGMITPPIGLNLFVMNAISGVGVIDIFKAAVPYFIILVGVLILVTYVPELSTTLPNYFYPK